MLPKSLSGPEGRILFFFFFGSTDFYTTGINLFLIEKSVDCNGSYFD